MDDASGGDLLSTSRLCSSRHRQIEYTNARVKQVQRGTVDAPAGLRAARQAFPFLEMLSRWAWRCKISAEEEATAGKRKKSVTKSFGKKSKRKREAEAAAAAAAAGAREEVRWSNGMVWLHSFSCCWCVNCALSLFNSSTATPLHANI